MLLFRNIFLYTLFIFIFLFLITSCSSDNGDFGSLSLNHVGEHSENIIIEEETIFLTYQVPVKVKIEGGNGKFYQVQSSNTGILDFKVEQDILEFYPKKTGQVTIQIQNGNNDISSINMDVNINYYSEAYKVDNTQVKIFADELSEEDSLWIEQDIQNQLGIEDGGGYHFTYTDAEQTKGTVHIYQQNIEDGDYVEGTFNIQRIHENGFNSSLIYNLNYDDISKELNYVVYESSSDTLFIESFNKVYQENFPISRVYVSQELNNYEFNN